MESINTSINLLRAVHNTMDGICITGIENQDKFLACANAIQTTIKALESISQKMEMDEKEKQNENVVEVEGG